MNSVTIPELIALVLIAGGYLVFCALVIKWILKVMVEIWKNY